MILSKEDFCKALKSVEEVADFRDELDAIFDKYDGVAPWFPTCDDSLVRVLETQFNTELIGTWCWEWNFGKDEHSYVICENKKIELSKPENLYEFLLDNIK